jgi:hypothetical protein
VLWTLDFDARLVPGRAEYELVAWWARLFVFDGEVRLDVDVEVDVRREEGPELCKVGTSENPESFLVIFVA